MSSTGRVIFTLGLVWVLHINLNAQTINFQSGISIRNNQTSHYHKMVTWDDSDYEEFAYWKESETGVILEFMNWRAIFPPDFNVANSTKYPMIIMLHSAGESGRKWTGNFNYTPSDPEYDNNGNQLKWGGQTHRDAVNDGTFPGVVIFPQCSYNGSWDADDLRMLTAIIEHMVSDYHINPFQITMHGLSNGAKGNWEYGRYRPDLIAGILPMSGVGSDIEPTTDQLVTTPVWLFQGSEDTNPSPGAAEKWIETLTNKGGKPKLTVYQGNGHNTWVDAYAEPEFFNWMKQRDKRKIYVFGDTSNVYITENGTVDFGFSAGFNGYQWTLDGSDISGATSRYYTAEQAGTYTVKFQDNISGAWQESFQFELEPYTGDPIVHIPDVNFKSALLDNTAINTNQDGQIQVTEAENYTGQINLNSRNISDLTGIEAFINISDLRVHYNNLTALDISAIPGLTQLHCQGNQLESLDISQNNQLTKLRCFDNNLSSLNVKNGNNHNFGLFQATGNSLTCIQVDDIAYAETNWTDNVDPGVEFNTTCAEGVVNIPDANFKSALVSDPNINSNGDNDIQFTEAENYMGGIDVPDLQIESLIGVEAFTQINSINFSNNGIASADFTENTLLESINGTNNQLTSVALGSNSNLSIVQLDNNALQEIDLSNLSGLTEVRVQSNQLQNLDLSNNGQLALIYCNDNSLESLNIKNGNNQSITDFQASNNLLTCVQVSDVNYANTNWSGSVDQGVEFSENCEGAIVNIPDQNFKNALLSMTGLNTNNDDEIQVSEAEVFTGQINVNSQNISDITGIEAFTELSDLRVHNNNITSIDVSANSQLIQLHCQKNNLTSLDISSNTMIEKLRCFNNDLTSLNVQNGNNDQFHLFQAYDNNLTCIQVDDVSYAEANWSDDVDTGVTFSTDCSSSGASARTATVENQQPSESMETSEINVYPNPTADILNISFSKQQYGEYPPLQIYNLNSGLVQQPTNITQSESGITIDMTNLSNGHYVIQVKDKTFRVIKQH